MAYAVASCAVAAALAGGAASCAVAAALAGGAASCAVAAASAGGAASCASAQDTPCGAAAGTGACADGALAPGMGAASRCLTGTDLARPVAAAMAAAPPLTCSELHAVLAEMFRQVVLAEMVCNQTVPNCSGLRMVCKWFANGLSRLAEMTCQV